MGGHHLRYPLPYPLPGFFPTTLPEPYPKSKSPTRRSLDLTDNSKEMREMKRPRYLLMVSKAAVIRVGEEKLVKFVHPRDHWPLMLAHSLVPPFTFTLGVI